MSFNLFHPKAPPPKDPSKRLENKQEENEPDLTFSSLGKSTKRRRVIMEMILYVLLFAIGYYFNEFINTDKNDVVTWEENKITFITLLYLGVGFAQGYVAGMLYNWWSNPNKDNDAQTIITISSMIAFTVYQIFGAFITFDYFWRFLGVPVIGICMVMLQWVIFLLTLLSGIDLNNLKNIDLTSKDK